MSKPKQNITIGQDFHHVTDVALYSYFEIFSRAL